MAKGKFAYWRQEDGLILLEGWARNGLTDEDIAHNIGISASTLYEWKKRFPEITEALKSSKEVADLIVENALFKRATGYDQETVKVFQYKGDPVVVPIVEHVAPDTTAAIFWLKNRKPVQWRGKPVPSEEEQGEYGVIILPPVEIIPPEIVDEDE